MKYHINPETGRAGQCTAKKGNCRFGAAVLHYGSKEDAAKAFEMSMEGKTFTKAVSKKAASEWADKVKQNPNLDSEPLTEIPYEWEGLSEMEKNELWNKDTIVRDWYWEARLNKLNHEAALVFAENWDDVSHAGFDREDNGGEAFDYMNEYDSLLSKYVDGTIKAQL